MEFQDTATDFDFRTRNDKLIPIMIKRLKACQIEAKEQRANQSQAFKRPFSMFSKNMSPSKSPSRRLSIENDENLVKSAQAINPPFFPASPNYPNLSNGDLSNRYVQNSILTFIFFSPFLYITLEISKCSVCCWGENRL